MGVQAYDLPDRALLARYRDNGDYTDCYTTTLAAPVTLAQFVTAFYTTWVFKLERIILKYAVKRPSADAEARAVAAGTSNAFAAWTVEDRSGNQLLMCDMQQRTRSWFMVEAEDDRATHLYFGSAVVTRKRGDSGERELGSVFSLLLGFHKLYSRVLLTAARRRLLRHLSAP